MPRLHYSKNNNSNNFGNICFKSINFEGQGKSIKRQTNTAQLNRQPKSKSKSSQIVYFLTQFSHLNRQTNTHTHTHTDTHIYNCCSLCRRSRSTANLHTPISLPISFKLELLFLGLWADLFALSKISLEISLYFQICTQVAWFAGFHYYFLGGISLCIHTLIHSLFVFELWRSSLKSR